MTLKNNRASLLCYIKLCASLQSLRWIQTGVIIRKHPIWVKKKLIFFVPCDPEIWQITLKNNRAPLLCYFKLFASFCSHMWIQTEVTVQIYPIWVKIDPFLCHVTLKQMTLKNNRAPHYAGGPRRPPPPQLHLRRSRDLAHASIPLAQTPWGLTGRAWLQAGAQQAVIAVDPSFKSLRIDSCNASALCQALCIITKWLVNSNWSYCPKTLNLGQNQCFCPVWSWNLMNDVEKQ